MIIRPIRKTDLDAFLKLAYTSSLGITNLPKNREILAEKIDHSIEAFAKKIDSPENEKYIFVLEDTKNKEICGTSGIISQTGVSAPIYFYRLETRALKYPPSSIQILKPVSYKREPSEIAGLYLRPDIRKGGFGKLLSLSRFLFIAAFRERFKNSFFAEIRGVIHSDNTSPFWEAVGRHFIDLSYDQLMKLSEKGREFIPDVLPKYPIYLPLLPLEVQAIIGKPHEKSQIALSMLQAEGFKFGNEIDIFDAGPRVVAKTSKIRAIKECVVGIVQGICEEEIVGEKYLLGNERLDFRATFGSLTVVTKSQLVIDKKTADALEVKVGDKVRYIASP